MRFDCSIKFPFDFKQFLDLDFRAFTKFFD